MQYHTFTGDSRYSMRGLNSRTHRGLFNVLALPGHGRSHVVFVLFME